VTTVHLVLSMLVAAYFATWLLRLLAVHLAARRMRQRGIVGAYVEAGFLRITVQVPARLCGYCGAPLTAANASTHCQTCTHAGMVPAVSAQLS
jgi:hypothetical protein